MSKTELTISVGQKEPHPLRLVFTLMLAASLSGLALATAYQVTKPIIDANNAAELRAAVFKVVPGAATLQRFALRDGTLEPIAEEAETADPVVYAAYDEDGRFRGWAIQNSGPGFQDTIRLLYGYDPQDEQVTGMEVLESRETPGLGDKIWKDEDFVSNFRGLDLQPPIVVVKDGRDAPNEVDAITGATISSKAIVKIINEGHAEWAAVLPPPETVPPPDTGTDAESSGVTNDGEGP